MNFQKIIDFFFLLTIFSLPLYLLRFTLFHIPTNLLEILALASIAFLLLSKKQALLKEWLGTLKPILTPSVILFSGLLLSFLANPWTLQGLGIIKSWFIIPFLFSLSLPLVFNSDKRIRLALNTLYISIFSVSFLALIYSYMGILTYDQRLSAFYLSPNHLAMFLSLGFFLFPYLYFKEKGVFGRYLLPCSLLVIALASYLTFSYASWLAVFLSFLSLLFINNSFSKKTSLFVLGVMLLSATFFAFQYDEPKLKNIADSRSSFSSRLMIWRTSVELTRDNPVLGIGPGNFQARYLDYQKYFPPYLEWAVPQPHNLYLAYYLQAGLLGLIGFLLLCYKWLTLGLKQKDAAFSAASLGILFYVLIHGLFDTPYWKNDLAFSFWIMFFLTIAFAKEQKLSQKSKV